jgi:hypothetical protein
MPIDYKVIDMPSMMARTVAFQDPANPSRWIRDDKWYYDIRVIYGSLLKFLKDNNLLKGDLEYSTIDDVVIMFTDLNALGQQLIKSGAKGRWLESFDRAESVKHPSDVRYLEKALSRITGHQRD